MINRINTSSVNSSKPSKNKPQFKGAVDGALMSALQFCEQYPMINVTVLDLSTAIVPRTVIEGSTNIFSGFEAFRRESSGLIVNCLIPSFIVLGLAKLMEKPIMGTKSALHNCWANEDTINLVTKYWDEASDSAVDPQKNAIYKNEPQKARAYNAIKEMLEETKGINGEEIVEFNDKTKKFNFHNDICEIVEGIFNPKPKISLFEGMKIRRAAKKAADKAGIMYVEDNPIARIINRTHVSKNIKIKRQQVRLDKKGKVIDEYFSQGLDAVLGNASQIIKELADGKDAKSFASKATKLLKYKSIGGLAIIIPLAISMQPFNRWVTAKFAGKKGAPIYKDFEQSQTKTLTPKEKRELFTQKLISISSMVGVALFSIMKKPDIQMFKSLTQFSGIFPTMDQTRLISTATFASRMGASEDKNELKEATMRDIATFISFYFIGDYVAKATASLIQLLHKDVRLINDLKKLKPGANIFQQFRHWAVNTSLKASSEVVSTKAEKMRSVCQFTNILFSLILLGIVIPRVYRHKTDKAREKELEAMGVDPDKYYPHFAMNNPDIANSPAFKKVCTSNN